MGDTGLYAYAIIRGVTGSTLAGAKGIHGAPLRLVEQGDLAAVVSDVELAEFGEEGLRSSLEDLSWLELVATAHDDVARGLSERTATAPLRLATVFLGEEGLRAQLSTWSAQANAALDRVEGRSEWSVKAYVDPQDEPAPEVVSEDPPGVADGKGVGRAYLMRRRAATQRREARADEVADLVMALHDELVGHAVAGRRLAAQDRRLSGHHGEMVLNGAYLVEDNRVRAFKELVGEVDDRHDHIRVELGGPWPPYSFATLEDVVAEDAS